MARKRRKATRRRRSRRVGALRLGGKDTGLKLLAVGAGFLLGGTINGMVDKFLPKTTDPVPVPTKAGETMATVGEIGIGGLFLMRRSSGTVGMATKIAGGVLAGAGLKRALKVLGIMSGYQSVPVIGRRSHSMAGYQSVPVIGASVTPAQLAGRTPPQLAGYTPAGSGVGAYTSQGSGVMGAIGCCNGSSGSGITSDTGSGYLG
jgi:hypothetical protein